MIGAFDLQGLADAGPTGGKTQHKPLELLRMMACERTMALSMQVAMDALWPDAEGDAARKSLENRQRSKKAKASKQEGLFKQVLKCIELLQDNPRHPGLNTHEYDSIDNPYDPATKVFEAYVQNRTPSAYRVFWCYGPNKNQVTIIAITPHP